MADMDDTPEAVETMAHDLLRAGHADAAGMLRRLLGRAQTAEAERDRLGVRTFGSADGSVLSSAPEVGESLEEIVKGEHQGP